MLIVVVLVLEGMFWGDRELGGGLEETCVAREHYRDGISRVWWGRKPVCSDNSSFALAGGGRWNLLLKC